MREPFWRLIGSDATMNSLLDRARLRLDHRWAPPHMSDYLDEELSSGPRQRMERHVSECEECRRLLAGLREVIGALHGLPTPSGMDASQIAASVRLQIQEPGSST
jgi:anti-sigma factor RsiW